MLKFINWFVAIAATVTFSLFATTYADASAIEDQQIWGTTVGINENTVLIKGAAKDNKAVADCITRLAYSKVFSSVMLRDLRSKGKNVVFKIICEVLVVAGDDKTIWSNEGLRAKIHQLMFPDE